MCPPTTHMLINVVQFEHNNHHLCLSSQQPAEQRTLYPESGRDDGDGAKLLSSRSTAGTTETTRTPEFPSPRNPPSAVRRWRRWAVGQRASQKYVFVICFENGNTATGLFFMLQILRVEEQHSPKAANQERAEQKRLRCSVCQAALPPPVQIPAR